MCTGMVTVMHTSSNGHTHTPLTMPITPAQINQGTMLDIMLPNQNGHIHTLSLDATDLMNLKMGMTIMKTTVADSTNHTHTYSLRCG